MGHGESFPNPFNKWQRVVHRNCTPVYAITESTTSRSSPTGPWDNVGFHSPKSTYILGQNTKLNDQQIDFSGVAGIGEEGSHNEWMRVAISEVHRTTYYCQPASCIPPPSPVSPIRVLVVGDFLPDDLRNGFWSDDAGESILKPVHRLKTLGGRGRQRINLGSAGLFSNFVLSGRQIM